MTPAAVERLAHVKAHVAAMERSLPNALANVRNGTGSPKGSTMALSAHAQARAMVAWFEGHDLGALRQWSFVQARLDRHVRGIETQKSQGAGMLDLLAPLLSNDRETIAWFANDDGPFYLDRVDNRRNFDFWAWQAMVALRGDWQRLEDRCRVVLANPPSDRSLQRYLGDHRFYLALATGDRVGMEDALRDMTAPKLAKSRSNDDSGFTTDLISTAAVICAKIAWFHGHAVQVDSPLVPAAWLDATPLPAYDAHYDFLD